MSMHQNQGACEFEQALQQLVEAGKMASFTVHWESGPITMHVSLRAAVWFLQALEGVPESFSLEAIGSWQALPVSYQYGTHKATLGVYQIDELEVFLRGRAAYQRRKYRDAVRAVRRKNLAIIAQAQKGGVAL